jgi:hypothetical protein
MTMPKTREPVARLPITAEHADKLRKLARCSLLPGSWDKRFIKDLHGSLIDGDGTGEVLMISDRQAEMIDKLAHKYRRQIAKMR